MQVSFWCRSLALPMLLACLNAFAAVPAPLEPWRNWVMQDQPWRACTLIAGEAGAVSDEYVCAWPGALQIDADSTGARFSQTWQLEAPAWVPLPGDSRLWPQDVSVEGRSVPLRPGPRPEIHLGAGRHRVTGCFSWNERPAALPVPSTVPWVRLHVDGAAIEMIEREGGSVLLGTGDGPRAQADSLRTEVWRLLTDDIPARLTTRISVHASGAPREERIGPVLPEGFEPVRLDGDWPARLGTDGHLRLRVEPGRGTIELEARATGPLETVTARLPDAHWQAQETWSWQAQPALRITTASGGIEVDPERAEVPPEWRSLPAFALRDGDLLRIEQRSRGQAADAHNALSLERELWLAFDGRSWFARDRLHGTMQRDWRLQAQPPWRLERASDEDRGIDLLVTGDAGGAGGVEWRRPEVELGASLVAPDGLRRLPVSGWQQPLDGVQTTLHLPPGVRLLMAPGADRAAGSWLESWSLLDVFLAALIVVLIARLLGPIGAVGAAGYLVLSHGEAGAPLWLLLAIAGVGLLARALPDGALARVATGSRAAVWGLLLLASLPFVAGQLRLAVYPQLEATVGASAMPHIASEPAAADRGRRLNPELAYPAPPAKPPPAPPAPPAPPPPEAPPPVIADDALESVTITGSRLDPAAFLAESTVVQTGPGEPDWDLGPRVELAWSGPVLPDQQVRLVLVPRTLVRLLRVLMAALLGLLLWRLLPRLRWRWPLAPAALVPWLVLFAPGVPEAHADAAFPPEYLLEDLQQRLQQPPECAPRCASLAQAIVETGDDRVRLVLEAHALAAVAFPVPFVDAAALHHIRIDGAPVDALAMQRGLAQVPLGRGVHRVELELTPGTDALTLRFPLRPARVQVSGPWQASGLAGERLLGDTLGLTRIQAGAQAMMTATQEFAPFVQVTRELYLGAEWRVRTVVARVAPARAGFSVAIPLIAGEQVTQADVPVDEGAATVAFAAGVDALAWTGTLERGAHLALTAPSLDGRAESWRVHVGPQWHVAFSGLPESQPADGAGGEHVFRFDPLPGETLQLDITRPEARPGPTLAIDGLVLQREPGRRAVDTRLSMEVRASRSAEHVLALPPGAELLEALRDGEKLNLVQDAGRISLPVLAGEQAFELHWREPQAIGFWARTPALDLGLPASNVTLRLELPAQRWLLAAFGPGVGPAVLYWSALALLLVIAVVLARSGRTPLKLHQWLLLVLGFSTLAWPALLLVAAWLLVLDWRHRAALPQSVALFNAMQAGIALLTVFALFAFVVAIPQGLLGAPDMQVAGQGSSAHSLRWFVDQVPATLPVASAFTLPLWVWRLAMLAWALWVANALVGWLRFGFAAWLREGHWRRSVRAPRAVLDEPPAPPPPPEQPA